MKTFPTLFKKTSTGKIQYWIIGVEGNSIVTKFGQLNGKEQETKDVISEGKNVGKTNETSPKEQALAEAQSAWEKKTKKGYVEDLNMANLGKVDESVIEGGIEPMLAHVFDDHGHKIKYPASVQPKLDGIRCIAVVKDGVCTLWTRTRKRITGMPHIARAVEDATTLMGDVVLDGELYNHEYKDNFETITSLVRQQEPAEGHEVVEYHVYDTPMNAPFPQRLYKLLKLKPNPSIKLVPTQEVKNEEEVKKAALDFQAAGYEGAMVRCASTSQTYENKRSYSLQKVKQFQDAEFRIIGADEGKGKLRGHLASFVCVTSMGEVFNAKMNGELSRLKDFWDKKDSFVGKLLTVKYQALTGKNKVPRFPVGVAIRDYE